MVDFGMIKTSMNLLEAAVWVLGGLVCVLVLGLFNWLQAHPTKQRQDHRRE